MYESALLEEGSSKYVLVLMELCTGGHLINLMNQFHGELSEKQILFVLKDIASGIMKMHSMKPPIAHRDIKMENILLENKRFKLCDFGSSTSETLDYKYYITFSPNTNIVSHQKQSKLSKKKYLNDLLL